MAFSKPSYLLLLLLLVLIVTDESLSQKPVVADARALQLMPNQENYSKFLATLGVVCKCCDGKAQGGCTSTWEGPCNNLQCVPWKFEH